VTAVGLLLTVYCSYQIFIAGGRCCSRFTHNSIFYGRLRGRQSGSDDSELWTANGSENRQRSDSAENSGYVTIKADFTDIENI